MERWRARFIARRLDGLHNEPRPGLLLSVLLDQVEDVVAATLEETPGKDTHWSRASMARRTGLSRSAIGRIWAQVRPQAAPAGLGSGEQRRDRIHADEFVLVKPHRGAVQRVAVLRAGRHRPRQPQGTGQHDPPLHHLAQQPRLRREAPPHRRQGKRSLTRHYR